MKRPPKARQHSWEDNYGMSYPGHLWVRCKKCGLECPQHRARRGVGDCDGLAVAIGAGIAFLIDTVKQGGRIP